MAEPVRSVKPPITNSWRALDLSLSQVGPWADT